MRYDGWAGLALFNKGTPELEIWACGKCGQHWAGDDAQAIAIWHCAKRFCRYCKKELGLNSKGAYTACTSCREKNAFEKAEKIPEAEYDGPVTDGDEYWPTTEEFRDLWDGIHDDWPQYLWACKIDKFSIDADRILEWACDSHHEEIYESLNDTEELCKFIEAWNAKQEAETWWQDTKRAVILEPLSEEEE
jgi:hypothetical protein